MSSSRSRLYIAVALLAACTLAGGAFATLLFASPERESPPLDEYADILTTLSEWSPQPVAPEQFVYASIHGMLSRLDPHTAFLEPEDFSAMREKQQGSFFGLGIQIQKRMGRITVIAPMEGTPAYKLGIRAGDIITHIEDEEIKEDVTTDDVVRKLRGPKGSQVTITIRRAGIDEPLRMKITRAEIPTFSVRYAFMMTPEVGYLLLADFTHTSSRELKSAIERLQKQGMKKLLLDLRGNPGGVLDQSVDVADVFLERGSKIVYTRGRTSSSAQDYGAPGDGLHFDQPLVVLVSRGSASASEIVAGAIQDHDRGLLVGQRTWGKGLVQSVYTLPYGAGLALTTAKYYTPSGRWIQVYAAGGITPDVVVKNNRDSKLLTQLLARNLPFNFAVNWLVKHPDVPRDVAVTTAMRDEFFKFAEAAKFSTADELHRTWNDDPNHDLVDLAIRVELVNAKYGLEAGWGVRATGDAQVQKALTLFGEAERIASLPKKKNPARAAKN